MLEFLRWMREERDSNELKNLEKECRDEVKAWFVNDFSLQPRGRFYDFVIHLWIWLIYRKFLPT